MDARVAVCKVGLEKPEPLLDDLQARVANAARGANWEPDIMTVGYGTPIRGSGHKACVVVASSAGGSGLLALSLTPLPAMLVSIKQSNYETLLFIPPRGWTEYGNTTVGLQRAVAEWLESLDIQVDPLVRAITQSVERLTALVRDLAADREQLQQLLEKAVRENRELAARNVNLARNVLQLSDELDALAMLGAAFGRGDPIDNRNASWFAHSVGKILSHAGAGIVGNRADAIFVWTTTSGWEELTPLVEAINWVLRATG